MLKKFKNKTSLFWLILMLFALSQGSVYGAQPLDDKNTPGGIDSLIGCDFNVPEGDIEKWMKAAKEEDGAQTLNHLYDFYLWKIVNVQDKNGETALMKAAHHLRVDNVVTLVELSANLNIKDEENQDVID